MTQTGHAKTITAPVEIPPPNAVQIHPPEFLRLPPPGQLCAWTGLYGWQKDISKSVARWEKQNPLESDDEHFEKPLPAPPSSLGWRIFTGFLKVVGQVSAYIIMAVFAVLVGLLTSGFKSRRRR